MVRGVQARGIGKTKEDQLDLLLSQIGGMEEKLEYYGAEEEPKPWYTYLTTPLEKVLNVIDTTNRLSAGLAMEVTSPSDDPMDTFLKTLTGERQVHYADVLEEAGVENKYVRGGVGFGLDVALDPLSYVGMGPARKIFQEGTEQLGSRVFKEVTEKALKEAGEKGVKGSVKEAVKVSDLLTGIAKEAGEQLPVSEAALKMTGSKQSLKKLLAKQISGLGESSKVLDLLPKSSDALVKQSLRNVTESMMREAYNKGGLKLKAFGMEKVLIPRTTLSKTYDDVFSKLRHIPGYDNFVGNPLVKRLGVIGKSAKRWLGIGFTPKYDIKSLSDPRMRDSMLETYELMENAIEGGEAHVLENVQDLFKQFFDKLGVKKGRKLMSAATVVREAPENIEEAIQYIGKGVVKQSPLVKYGKGKLPAPSAKKLADVVYADREHLSSTLRTLVKSAGDGIPDRVRKNLSEIADLMDEVPEHDLWQVVDTLKKGFDDVVDQEMKRGILENARENYVTHLLTPEGYDYINAKNIKVVPFGKGGKVWKVIDPYGKKREVEGTILEINRALKHEVGGNLFETQAHRIYAKRKMTAVRAIAKHDAIEKMKTLTGLNGEKFFLKVDDALKPAGWEPISGIDELEGWVVHPELHPIVSRYKDLIINEEAMRGFLGAYDNVLNLWKGTATAANPGFHGRNWFSGLWQGYLHHGMSYMNPRLHKMAMDVLAGGEGTLKTATGVLKYSEIRNMLIDTGSLWKGQLGADIPRKFGQAIDEMVTPLAKKMIHPMKGGRTVGTFVENQQRAVDFILSLSKGMDPLNASRATKHFFFDYKDITAFERNVMRRTFPFYVWARKNIPLELEQMIAQPNKFAGIGKFKRGVHEMAEEKETERKAQAGWFKELYPIKVPEPMANAIHLMLGIDKSKVVYWNPNLPPQDINRLNLSELITSLTPPAKVVAEMYFNKNVFFDTEIEAYKGQKYTVPYYMNILRGFIPDDSPIFKSLGMEFRKRDGKSVMVMPAKQRYFLDQISPFIKNIGMALGTIPEGEEKARLLAWLSGVKFQPLDVKQETMERTLERQKELKDLIQLAKSRGQIPIGAQKKKGPLGQTTYQAPQGGGGIGR